MPTNTALESDLLPRFERLLGERHWPIADNFAPGLTDDEIDEAIAPLGISLPDEGRAWWHWHDGVLQGASARNLGPGQECITLSEAVEDCERLRSMQARLKADLGEQATSWSQAWLPITRGRPLILIDTDVRREAPMPVWAYHFDDVPPTVPTLDSLQALVKLWIRVLEQGAWEYDPPSGRWRHHPELLEDWVRLSGIA